MVKCILLTGLKGIDVAMEVHCLPDPFADKSIRSELSNVVEILSL
jgi:hypothetical protein